MAGVYSIFNIGTGHSHNETNNTIANLWLACNGRNPEEKYVNDGPGVHWYDMAGKMAGQGMDPRRRATVAKVLEMTPDTVNLTGHSRGAILCHMIANDLAEHGFRKPINMIVVDPVHVSNSHGGRASTFNKRMMLGEYIGILMENVTKSIFPLTAVQAHAKMHNRISYMTMPGSHGSGTQDKTSAIGETVSAIIRCYMSSWGTTFGGRNPSYAQIVELFARIHLENPVQVSKKGVAKRWITDDEKGMGNVTKRAYQKFGRQDQISGMLAHGSILEAGRAATDFQNPEYFFNEFHQWCFSQAFPETAKAFDGRAYSSELMRSERVQIWNNYPATRRSLQQQGMI